MLSFLYSKEFSLTLSNNSILNYQISVYLNVALTIYYHIHCYMAIKIINSIYHCDIGVFFMSYGTHPSHLLYLYVCVTYCARYLACKPFHILFILILGKHENRFPLLADCKILFVSLPLNHQKNVLSSFLLF